jgi:predicted transcriptional regulator
MEAGKGTIEKIEQLVEDRMIVEVEGRKYTPVTLKPVMYIPRPETTAVHNLRGFCGFITNDIDKRIDKERSLIIVDSPEQVRLVSAVGNDDLKREELIQAELNEGLETFPFGTFMSQEEFAIRFRSLFTQKKDDDFEYVLSYASKLVGGTQIDGDDDGITQKVSVKRGLSGILKDQVSLKPVVKLSPYRTFREVEQPASEFLLRVRLDSNDVPTVALFEADGGSWINQATENVVQYIQSIVPAIPVIA